MIRNIWLDGRYMLQQATNLTGGKQKVQVVSSKWLIKWKIISWETSVD